MHPPSHTPLAAGGDMWGAPENLGIPSKGRATSSLFQVTCAEPGSVPCGLCRCLPVLEDGARCHASACPQKWVICRKFFSLREDLETGGQQKGQGSWGEGGRTAELCSRTPCSRVTVLPNACRVLFTGDTQKEEGLGAEQGEQHPQSSPAPPPWLQGSVSTCTDPLHKDQQHRGGCSLDTHHTGDPGNEQE